MFKPEWHHAPMHIALPPSYLHHRHEYDYLLDAMDGVSYRLVDWTLLIALIDNMTMVMHFTPYSGRNCVARRRAHPLPSFHPSFHY
jgi:hypothetical protein